MKTQAAPSRVDASAAPALALQRKCACGENAGLTGECEECRQKHMGVVQRSALGSGHPTAPPIVGRVLASPGQPLDAATRAFLEPRFGHDFSQVRVHTDAQAAESARVVSALAYTVGRNVVFGAGRYAPRTSEGLKLVAHELTHVIQQRASHSRHEHLTIELSGTAYEREADRISRSVVNTGVASPVIPGISSLGLQRQETAAAVDVMDEPEPVTEPHRRGERRRAPTHADAALASFQQFEREHPREARQADRLDSAFGQAANHLDVILSGYDIFERASTHPILTRYQRALRTADTRRQRMAEAGFSAVSLYDWVNGLRQALVAMGRVLTALEHEVADDPDIQEVRTERTTAANVATETLGLSFVQEGRSEREEEAGGTETAERDVTHETTEALRSYVRRNYSSIRTHASLHVGSIRDILTRHLGRDQAVINQFLERLHVSEPELSSAIALDGELARALSERTFIDEADDELRSYVAQHRAEIESDPDSQVGPIMAILHSHLGLSATVVRQYLDRLQTIDIELYSAVSLGGRTLAEFVARERPVLPSLGRALLHGLMGEWHTGTDTTGMTAAESEEAEAEDFTSIGVSTIVGLIPGLDQASDARDLTAHTYFLITEEGEISSPLRWIGLVFSLIGAIPEIGTAIKGLSQVLMRGVGRHGYRAVARVYNFIERVLPGAIDAILDMRRGLIEGWETFATRGRSIWSEFLTRGRSVLETLIDLTAERFARLQEFTSRMMPDAFTRARALFEEAFDAVASTARRLATGIAEGVPRFLDGVRTRIMSLDATGRLRLEAERLDTLERTAREAFERGDTSTAERLARELDELVTGAERQADELGTPPPEHLTAPDVGETPTRVASEPTPERIDHRLPEGGEASPRTTAAASEAPTEAVLDAESDALRATVREPEAVHPVSDPDLIEEGYEAEIRIGEHTYRRQVDGTWCRFSDELCGVAVDPEVDQAVEHALVEFTSAAPSQPYPTTARLARGNLGERLAAEALAADGHRILMYKPSILGTNQGGIDIVTIRNGVVYLIDNKALSRSGNVSSVSALTTNFAGNLADARSELTGMLADLSRSEAERQVIQEALDALDAGNYVRAVTNGNLTEDTRVLTGVTQQLQSLGIQFIDVFP